MEIAGVEIAAPDCRGETGESGNRGIRRQGWKTRQKGAWKAKISVL